MARYHGKIGFGHTEARAHGKSELVITEKTVMGTINNVTIKQDDSSQVQANLKPMHSVTINANSYVLSNVPAIRYVVWLGVRWTVTNIQVQHPRLTLRLGEVYNGPTP